MEWPPKSLRKNGTRQSSPTDASMPMRLSGTERVGQHGLSLPPSFPRTGGTPRSNVLQFLKDNHHEATPVSTEKFRILPFLVLPCPRADGTVHPGRSWLRCPVRRKGAPKGDVHRQLRTEVQGDLSRALPWPYHRSRTQQGPCRGVSRCIARWPRLHGTLSPECALE